MTYVCENEDCSIAFREVELERGQTADCPVCGWSMTAV